MAQMLEQQAIEQLQPVPANPSPPAPRTSTRLRVHVLGVTLLPDGRAVAVGLRPKRNGPPRAFVYVAGSAEELVLELRTRAIICKRVHLCLPRQKLITKTFRLPSTDDDEIRAMLDFELQSAIPFSEGKLARAYLASTDEEGGYSDIVAFITPETVVETHTASLYNGGYIPDRILASPVLLLAWARILYGFDEAASRSLLLLAASATSLEAVSVQGERLRYCRSFALGLDAAKLNAAMEEAIRELAATQSADGNTRIVLIAPDPQAQVMRQLIERAQSTGVVAKATVEHASPLGAAGNETDCVWGNDLAAAVACAAGAAAAAFVPELAGFDLRVDTLMRPRRRAEFRRRMASSIVAALLFVGFGVAALHRQMRLEQDQIQSLEAQIAPIQKTALAVSDKRQKLMLLRAHLDGRERPLAALAELHQIIPRGINLIELSIVGPEMKITAQARSPDLAYALPSILAKSPLFHAVQFRAAYPVAQGGRTVTEFACSCRIAMDDPISTGSK